MSDNQEDQEDVERTVVMWKRALGQQLALERKEKGLNQTQVGQRLGVSQRTISELEHGKNPTVDHLLNYCIVVELDFAVLAARARAVLRSREQGENLLL